MTQPTRPYDALYDNTFTVAGPRDHYRQQTLGGGFNIERAPVYNNFFSELPHHPPSTLRLKNGDRIPGFIDRNFHPQPRNPADLQQRSDALAVSGPHRPKYFRRPLLAAAEIHIKQAPTLPPLPQYQDLNATAPAAMGGAGGAAEPRSKTIGTQSDYRENEAQTAPWEPGYVLPEHPTAKQLALSKRYHTDGPEVLHLRDMAFADGLPAGLQEVTRIDKMRAKRAFEATLPPIEDAARLPLRQKMIEEWEAREWEEREQEILGIQEQRLALLENALQVREEEIDEEHRARVDDRKKATLAARAGKFADVQATRIKTMRQLIESRKYVEKHRKLHKPTIVERYANFGSNTYAPLQREGRFPESKPMGQEIETEGYEPVTLRGVMDLEAFLPRSQLNPKIAPPKRPHRLDFAGRKEAAVQRDLKAINDLLDTSKVTSGRGHGECWPAPLADDAGGSGGGGMPSAGGSASGGTLKRPSSGLGGAKAGLGSAGGGTGPMVPPAGGSGPLAPMPSAGGSPRRVVRAVERPPTPELPAPPALLQPQRAALVLLQRLLRGRAAQNVMYEGRLRRQELIAELRLGERVSPDGTRLDGKPIRRPDERDAATLRIDALLGTMVSEVCAVLSESDPQKRDALLAALSSSAAHAAAASVAAAAADIAAASAAGKAASAAAAAAVAAVPAPSPLRRGSAEAAAPPPPPAAALAAEQDPAALDSLSLEALGITKEQAEEAAVRIQAAFHGHKARKEVAAMRARGELLRRVMTDGDEGKVVKCQAAVRGYLGRKRVQGIKAVRATEAEAEAEAAAAAASGGGDGGGDAPEAEASASAADAYDLSSYTDEHVQAITRIQAARRGMMDRRRVAAMRAGPQEQELEPEGSSAAAVESSAVGEEQEAADDAAAVAEAEASAAAEAQEAQQAEAEASQPPPPVHSDYTVEQEVAVIRIQAAGRGFLARKRVAAIRTGGEGGAGDESEAAPRSPVIGRKAAPEEPQAAHDAGGAGEGAKGAAEGQEGAEEQQQEQQQEEEELWPKMSAVPGMPLRSVGALEGAEEAEGSPAGEEGDGGEGGGEGREGQEREEQEGDGGAEEPEQPEAEATQPEEAGPEASLAAGVESASAADVVAAGGGAEGYGGDAEAEVSLLLGDSGAAGRGEGGDDGGALGEASLAGGGSVPPDGEASLAGGGTGGGEEGGEGEGDAPDGDGEGGEAEPAAVEGEASLATGGNGEEPAGDAGEEEGAAAEASMAAGEGEEGAGGVEGEEGQGEGGYGGEGEDEPQGEGYGEGEPAAEAASGEASGWAAEGEGAAEEEAGGEEGVAD